MGDSHPAPPHEPEPRSDPDARPRNSWIAPGSSNVVDAPSADERPTEDEPTRGRRMLSLDIWPVQQYVRERQHKHYAPLLLRGVVSVPGVRDVVSGFAIFRLVVLRNAIRSQSGPLLVSDDWAANAELYWRTGRYARRVEALPSSERHDLRGRPSRVQVWDAVNGLWAARAKLRATPIPPAPAEPSARRESERQAEAVS